MPPSAVPFPRGFAFGQDGRLFLASGIGPNGQGDNTILAFPPAASMTPSRLVADPELSSLDLTIAPNGNEMLKLYPAWINRGALWSSVRAIRT